MLQKEKKIKFSRRYSDPGTEFLLFFKRLSDIFYIHYVWKSQIDCRINVKIGPQMLQKEKKVKFSRRYSDPRNEFLLFFKHLSDVFYINYIWKSKIDCRISVKFGPQMLKKEKKK